MAMGILPIIRLALLGTVILFSIIVLGLAANTISLLNGTIPSQFTYAPLGVAISVITLVVLAPMVIIEFLRRGAITSWLMIEMIVCVVLGILWLATAADASGSDVSESFSGGCSFFGSSKAVSELETACHSWQAIQAFGYLNWIFLKGYATLLLILAIIQNSRGNKGVWQTPVAEVPFFGGNNASSGPPMTDKMGYPQQAATADHSYPPQNYPEQAYTPPQGGIQV